MQATDKTSLRELIEIKSNYYILLESLYPETAQVHLNSNASDQYLEGACFESGPDIGYCDLRFLVVFFHVNAGLVPQTKP
jgi:hypothetical protein